MEYLTVAAPAQGEMTEKRSRFIGHIAPVTSEEEAAAFVAKTRQEHWDATHNVYAYVLRQGQMRRYSDDGEPQGTAGIPLLDVIVRNGLTDTAVIVTRYFGGILLGAGGLVRAYGHAAKLALDHAELRRMVLCNDVTVRADYNLYGKIVGILPRFDGELEDSKFSEDILLKIDIPTETVPAFAAEITDLSGGRAGIEVGGECYRSRNKK